MANDTVVSVDDLLEAGNRALDAGNYAAALDHWTRALEVDPGNTRAEGLVAELQSLIQDKHVATMTPMFGEFVVVVDDDIELEMDVADALPAESAGRIARGALDRLQRVLIEHEAQGAALADQVGMLEKQLLEARTRLRDQEAIQRQRDRQLAELEHAIEEQRAGHAALRHDNAAAQAAHAAALEAQAAAHAATLEEHAAAHAVALATQKAELDRVQGQLQDAELERAAAVAEVEGLSDELAEMRNALTSEHAEVEELRASVSRLTTELNTSQAALAASQASLTTASAQATAAGEAVATRDARIRSLETDTEVLRTERDDATSRADRLEERVSDLSQEIAELRRELTASGTSRPTAAQRPSLSPVLERAPAPTPVETRAITGTYESVANAIEPSANPGDVEQDDAFIALGDSGLELAGYDVSDDTDDDIELDDAALDALLADDVDGVPGFGDAASSSSPPPAPPGVASAQHTMIGHGINLYELGELPSVTTSRAASGASTPVEAVHALVVEPEHTADPTPTQSSAAHHLFDTSLSAMERLSWVLDEAPQLSTTELAPGQEIDSQAAFVLQMIDEGGVTFADVIDMVGLPAEEAAAILIDLLTRKILTTASLDA
jgi:archaellum component FlaC